MGSPANVRATYSHWVAHGSCVAIGLSVGTGVGALYTHDCNRIGSRMGMVCPQWLNHACNTHLIYTGLAICRHDLGGNGTLDDNEFNHPGLATGEWWPDPIFSPSV